ncbi:hypothetical protein HOLleu_13460 [Holothuria leucospilota]|uniref:Uncharacterized protein n=1 Tax=Holothuria leucospilota TaxID=206669 RepID=A0A9Q1CCJ0_HOLLE|nr:hypothetical protein HOLleu_13460 [Holothuria leucospilota]
MPYSERKNPIIFGGVQRSSGVTGGQTLKTLLTQYLNMHCGENMNTIIFGGGQRSSWVNADQTLKSLLTRIFR